MNDQPERRGNLKLANGNSIIHGRFGMLIDCRQLKDVIRSCNRCTRSIIDEIDLGVKINNYWRGNNCELCSAWLFNIDNNLLTYKPDKDYPNYLDNNDGLVDGKLRTKMINKNICVNAIIAVTNGLVDNTISQKQAKSFLKYNGLNNQIQETIISKANNIKKKNDIETNRNSRTTEYDQLQQNVIMYPADYQMHQLPSSWYDSDNMGIFVDVPMHLLMLGVVKSTMLKVNMWLRSKNNNAMFVSMTKGVLGIIKK
jgi:hypothetical protein